MILSNPREKLEKNKSVDCALYIVLSIGTGYWRTTSMTSHWTRINLIGIARKFASRKRFHGNGRWMEWSRLWFDGRREMEWRGNRSYVLSHSFSHSLIEEDVNERRKTVFEHPSELSHVENSIGWRNILGYLVRWTRSVSDAMNITHLFQLWSECTQ